VNTVKTTTCPACSHVLEEASAVDGKPTAPVPGDLSVCLYCARLLQFTEDLDVRVMTEADIAQLPNKTRIEVQLTQWAITQLISALPALP